MIGRLALELPTNMVHLRGLPAFAAFVERSHGGDEDSMEEQHCPAKTFSQGEQNIEKRLGLEQRPDETMTSKSSAIVALDNQTYT